MPVRVLLGSIALLWLVSCGQRQGGDLSKGPKLSASIDFDTCEKQVIELNQTLRCQKPDEKLPVDEMVKLTEADREFLFVRMKCGGLKGDPFQQSQNWKSLLPDCPVTNLNLAKEGWFKDFTTDPYHPGAESCYRKKIANKNWPEISAPWWQKIPGAIQKILRTHPPGQQCCYDKKQKLILNGPGAGTPDLVSVDNQKGSGSSGIVYLSLPEPNSLLAHLTMDVRMIDKCLFPKEIWKLKNWEIYHKLGWEPNVPK
jgi:hypothetical protein